MKTIAVLDYFMNKNLKVVDIPDDIELNHWDKISYLVEEKWANKESIWIVVGYPLEVDRTAHFLKR